MMRQIWCATVLTLGCLAGQHVWAQIPAFSGAKGPGAYATGGRGGDVYHVTNLEFDKDGLIPGSLKYGINNAPAAGRTIVFDVGGTIYQNGGGSNWWFRGGKSNITIAGQTAPGGITIAGVGAKFTGNNNILRNITVRPNKDPVNPTSFTYDSFALQLTNSIVDHVSATWFTDEGISLTDAGANTTVQYATIGEGLNYDGHSYGSIIATEVNGTQYSYHHNLYAHNNSRMPRLGSVTGSTGAVLNWSNNVIYNWQSKAGYSGTDQHSRSNFIGNYYIKGPNNGTTVFDGGDDSTRPGFTQIYQSKTTGLANYYDNDKDGNLYDGVPFAPGDTLPNGQKYYAGNTTFVNTPFTVNGTGTPDTANVALERVLDYGGANWWSRNSIDQRIIDSVKTGTGRLINDLTSGVQATEWANVLAQRPSGGLAPFQRDANWDFDNDGMPGVWEFEHGLDPNVANNNGDFDTDGYTDLEEYLNDIAAWPAPVAILFNAATNTRYAQITNWDSDPGATSVVNWQPSRFDTAVINQGTVVVDAVGQHAGNLVLGANPGDNVTLDITAGWLKVENAPHGLSDGIVSIGDNPTATASLNLSGGRLRSETLLKGASGTFNFTGGVLSADTVGFDLVNNGGTLAPGESAGTTYVMGDLTLNAGSLSVELGGTNAGKFDSLVIDGAAALGGTLDVALVDGFEPSVGQFFQFITANEGIFFEFSSVNLPELTGGHALRLVYGETLVGLEVVAGLAGDFDGDGDVDGRDFLVWQRNPSVGDLVDWQANYGAGNVEASGVVVPEPSSWFMAVAVLVLNCCRRRSR